MQILIFEARHQTLGNASLAVLKVGDQSTQVFAPVVSDGNVNVNHVSKHFLAGLNPAFLLQVGNIEIDFMGQDIWLEDGQVLGQSYTGELSGNWGNRNVTLSNAKYNLAPLGKELRRLMEQKSAPVEEEKPKGPVVLGDDFMPIKDTGIAGGPAPELAAPPAPEVPTFVAPDEVEETAKPTPEPLKPMAGHGPSGMKVGKNKSKDKPVVLTSLADLQTVYSEDDGKNAPMIQLTDLKEDEEAPTPIEEPTLTGTPTFA